MKQWRVVKYRSVLLIALQLLFVLSATSQAPFDTATANLFAVEPRLEVSELAPNETKASADDDLITQAEWEAIVDGRNYRRKRNERLPPRERNTGLDMPVGWLDGLSTVMWVIVVVLLVGLLIWLALRSRPDTSVDKGGLAFNLTDELLGASEEELQDGLTTRLGSGDYQGAIRYRFGQLLPALKQQGLLVWVPGKTNEDYSNELAGQYAAPFMVLAKAFAYAMFSGREVTPQQYEHFARGADDFMTLLPAQGKPSGARFASQNLRRT